MEANQQEESLTKTKATVRLAPVEHRVLIYCTCYNVLDGVTLTIRKLEQEILAAGHYVCILTTVSGDMANTHLDGTHCNRQVIFMDNAIPIPFLDDPEHPELSYQLGFSLSKSVKDQIDQFEPTLLHLTVPDCTTLHLIQYARLKEVPIMGTYHSNIPEYMEHYPGLSWLKHVLGSFFRHQYNYLQTLYVPTPFIQKHLQDSYKMHKVTNLRVWGRGVDTARFNPAFRSLPYRESLGLSPDTTIVLWVGRLVPEKRPDIFAAVIRKLAKTNVKFHALVVGAGPCENVIKSLPNTTFAGWMSADQLSTAYASADVFLFPSSVETFGNVTLEAAASGLPVVVEAGCSGHLVSENWNGVAVEEGNIEGFYEATLNLIHDKDTREEYSANSREMSLGLEKRTVVRQMLENYNRVTEEFYAEYAGRHCNRDKVYDNPDSFLLGIHPRPILLVIVELTFIVLFYVCWQIGSCWMYLSNSIRRRAHRPPRTRLNSAVPSPVPEKQRKKRKDVSYTTPSTTTTVVEMNTVLEMGDCKVPLLNDDNTATTGTSSHTSVHSKKTFGDCNLSHAVIKLIIAVFSFQCRIESRTRTAWQNMTQHVVLVNRSRPKRKNSSFGVDEESADLQVPRNLMRRNQSTVIDLRS